MKKIVCSILGVCALFAAANIYAQEVVTIKASKNYIKRDITKLQAFEAVSIMDDIDVEFRQNADKDAAVYVYGSDNVLDIVRVSVVNGDLQVRFAQPTRIKGERRLKVIVAAPELSRVLVQNDGEFKLLGALTTDELDLQIVGKGKIALSSLKADTLNLKANGEGEVDINFMDIKNVKAAASDKAEIELKGIAGDMVLQNNGSETLDAENVRASKVKAIVNGSGDIKCFAIEQLDAQANGKGKLIYKGYPAQVNKMGDLKKIKQD